MFIDTHCHLTFPEYNEDRITVISNAKKAGIKHFIVPGVDLFSNKLALELAASQPLSIKAAIGFHPYEAQESPPVWELSHMITHDVVAIGECGLDYHLYKGEEAASKKTNQIRIFREQIELAIEHKLPLIMHCRDAFDDFFSTLDEYHGQYRGVIHCFSGGLQEVRCALERGLYMGIDGNITFSKDLQRIISHIPLPSLLLETDSPYLTPVPFRGKRNEPKHLRETAAYISQALSISQAALAEQTTANAKELFALQLSVDY
jgi:TatD DNase family protein